MKQLNVWVALAVVAVAPAAFGQSNPAPHALAGSDYVFTGFPDPESTVYPANSQGWRFGAEPGPGFTGPATDDRVLAPFSSSVTSGSIRNEGQGGLSFLNSGSNHIGAWVVALNTTDVTAGFVSWVAEDIRAGDTRKNAVELQYRVGTMGDFTPVAGTTYQSNPAGLAASQSFNIPLPAAALGQPVVQLRWLYSMVEGSGSRDRIRIGNVVVSQEDVSSTVPVTFRVDVSQFTGTISPSGMHIAGSFATDQWTPAARPMTNEGNGIWSYTELLEPGTELQYKFVRGSNWTDGDESVAGLPCAAPGEGNRLLVVPNAAVVLPPVCINSCEPCQTNPVSVSVTFRVDMSNETVMVGSGSTGISGTFNGWTFQQMTNEGNGIWSFTIQANSGSSVQYKFRNGTQMWEIVPAACSVSPPFNNRNLIVPNEDIVLPAVCFGSCEACSTPGETFALTFSVDMSNETVSPDGVHIAGNFNGFTPVPMATANGIVYTYTANIEAGSTVLWKYLNGNGFDFVEAVPAACGAPDGFDGFNRSFEMPNQATILPTVCFGSCEACPGSTNNFMLVFQVDASQVTPLNPSGIHIAGSFNGWSPVAMTNAGGGLYTFTATVAGGTEVQWKYLNGPSFDGAETVPAACGAPDGFGGFNRLFTMASGNQVLPVVCFGSCEACGGGPQTFTLVFQVDGAQLPQISPAGIHIAGNFNGWNPVPMQPAGAALFTFSTNVAEGTQVQWKYLNGPTFNAVETVPANCGTDDGFGGNNRVFNMPGQVTVLDVVCFASCVACIPDGLNEASRGGQLLVYPNPSDGVVQFRAPAAGNALLVLTDLRGRIIGQVRMALALNEWVQPTLPALSSGIYSVSLYTDGAAYHQKLVVH